MIGRDNAVAPPLWDDSTSPNDGHQTGVYLAISGNTSAGKSSIIQAAVRLAAERGQAIVGVSEREFHHPYLRLMFADPKQFAFGIQLQFMLQRHLVLLRQLSLGRTIFLERSHFDDELFVMEHAETGAISPDEVKAYGLLSKVLHARIPAPDILVLLNPPADVSLKRLRRSEESGERPREFPDDRSQEHWVRRWHSLYESFHRDLRQRAKTDPHFSRTLLLEPEPNQPVEFTAGQIVNSLFNGLPTRARSS